ncbi:MAG: sensor histidine kinase [Paracoccaceae bacterium]
MTADLPEMRGRPGRVALTGSLRRNLVLQFLALAAVVAVALFFAVRVTADRAAEAAQDAVLGAATAALSEGLRAEDDGLDLDLPPTIFSMLSAMGEDRVFYRVDIGSRTVTGYDDLPLPTAPPQGALPVYYDGRYLDTPIRLAAVTRGMLVDGRQAQALFVLGQTRFGQRAIADSIARRAALLGIGFFLLAVPLSLLAARAILGPVGRVTEAVARRGPLDLRPVNQSVPRELGPLIGALNGFILRLRGAHARTETFITEAAHHIRTPLSTVRTEAEIALRQSQEEPTRARLRNVIRSVEESSRSAGQLLEHALVLYRTDRVERSSMDLAAVVAGLVESFRPTADLREIALRLGPDLPAAPVVGDRLMIETALRNILDNAIKYSAADGTVEIALTLCDGRAVVAVCDRGRGLGGAKLADLATRFRRGGNVTDVVGSGLGLTIVTEVAEASGGAFTLTPREGGGTCAVFSLPLR